MFDNSIIRHGNCENIRDYEIFGYLSGQDFDIEVRYIFKGCIQVGFKNTVEPKYFSMDDRLLDLSRQNELDYPQAFVWAAGADVYPGWKFEENSNELKALEKIYQRKFYKFYIETNAYNLELIFHDLEVNIVRKYEKTNIQNLA